MDDDEIDDIIVDDSLKAKYKVFLENGQYFTVECQGQDEKQIEDAIKSHIQRVEQHCHSKAIKVVETI